ncbi:hypothetical protein CRU94_09405 [Arcobacter sp. AHV-9/2010]|uniref:hypothetical protein n=1 Tax=Arcobacter sp. AHV-9/2010 TaxID=2021861 RepID=UPI00100B6540|nr:hypothetical protein [Arcobacter sp. CECT 9299]RXJ94037.1 hypothetical protein CRU94_09405 [Arcobacter sp. CECT 9299]
MKHVLYPTVVKPQSIGGIPRIALLVVIIGVTPLLPLMGILFNPLFGILITILFLGIFWIVMKIISIQDPDYILILISKLKHLKESQKYVA